jgi:hypothetical protein
LHLLSLRHAGVGDPEDDASVTDLVQDDVAGQSRIAQATKKMAPTIP